MPHLYDPGVPRVVEGDVEVLRCGTALQGHLSGRLPVSGQGQEGGLDHARPQGQTHYRGLDRLVRPRSAGGVGLGGACWIGLLFSLFIT